MLFDIDYQLKQELRIMGDRVGCFTMFHSLDGQMAECPDGQKPKRLDSWKAERQSCKNCKDKFTAADDRKDKMGLLSIIVQKSSVLLFVTYPTI